MDPKIHSYYNKEILAEVSARFAIDIDTLEELDGFESYIYSFDKDGKSYILRVGHSSHRDANAVQGEAEFIDYLGANGIHVGRPLRNAQGNLVEAIPAAEGHFVAVVFNKVPGNHAPREMWRDDALWVKLGRLLGRMHSLTKDFAPSNEKYRRLSWESDNEVAWNVIQNGLSSEEARLVGGKWQQLVDQVSELPKDRDNHGLIHNDVHGGNFFLHDGEIQLFDFDDSLYSWFANDIAMVFYYGSFGFRDDPQKLKQLTKSFFAGYAEENEINPIWLEHIPAFLSLRDLILYAVVQHDIPEDEWNEWCKNLLRDVRSRLATDDPVLPLDFTTLLD